jgi:hypothetical protein
MDNTRWLREASIRLRQRILDEEDELVSIDRSRTARVARRRALSVIDGRLADLRASVT